MDGMGNLVKSGWAVEHESLATDSSTEEVDALRKSMLLFFKKHDTNYESDTIADAYELIVDEMTDVFRAKNGDYGNAFLQFRPTTFIDLIRAKLDRVENILRLEAEGKQPLVSEGVESEMRDIANYCILMLVARGHKE